MVRRYHLYAPRWRLLLGLLPVLLLPVSCNSSTNLGSNPDPCLLQQYQKTSEAIISTLQGSVKAALWLARETNVDLSAPASSTNQGSTIADVQTRDITETLGQLAEFVRTLDAQLGLWKQEAKPDSDPAFNSTNQAVTTLTRAAPLVAQAYIDAQSGNTRAAHIIAVKARNTLWQGRLLLDQAAIELNSLHSASNNC